MGSYLGEEVYNYIQKWVPQDPCGLHPPLSYYLTLPYNHISRTIYIPYGRRASYGAVNIRSRHSHRMTFPRFRFVLADDMLRRTRSWPRMATPVRSHMSEYGSARSRPPRH
eukprot:2105879-Pleurochrysis_carterae.AAC.4